MTEPSEAVFTVSVDPTCNKPPSAGTDHETSGPVLVAGESVNNGLHGVYPLLPDLVDGDLKTTTDFRAVYSSLLTDWLGIDADLPLGGEFAPLDLVKLS